MPKLIRPEELDSIVFAISRYPGGIGIEGLLENAGLGLTHRTLQRRLSQLVADGRLVTEGEGRALKYKATPIHGKAQTAEPRLGSDAGLESYIPLSPEGQEIKKHVRQVPQMRIPVGYNQDFLEAYYPNENSYLAEDLRDQLRTLGTPPDKDRPAGTFARDIINRLLIDLSWASSRLEGNTYSRLDTERLIEFGQAAEGKDALETQMILNHKAAIELLVNEADLIDFSPYTIFSLHALLSDGLLADQSAGGRIRNRAVNIGGSVYRPIAIPQRIDELFRIMLSMANEIHDPFEQSFFIMVHLPYLQPFEDENKRVSRLAANIPLIRHNLCPLSFIDVPEHDYIDAMLGIYELNRIELLRDVFVWAYERSCQQYVAIRRELVPPDPFRLRYRAALGEAVKTIVLGLQPLSEEKVISAIPASVTNDDRLKFTALVLEEFKNLHEGNAIRFGIRPADFIRWKKLSSR